MAGVLGQQFGYKRPPLSVTIKSILDRYPDGQIFKVHVCDTEGAGPIKSGSVVAGGGGGGERGRNTPHFLQFL